MLRRLLPALALCVALAACGGDDAPSSRLSGLLLDGELAETSGLAASRAHPGTLWLVEDGGNPARLHAVSRRGRRIASYDIDGAPNTDWEDLSAFEHDGKRYLLVADTGDNGGLRRTLLLHAIEEPARLRDGGTLEPAWSIAFRWPDGPRDCEAVAVDDAPTSTELAIRAKEVEVVDYFRAMQREHGIRGTWKGTASAGHAAPGSRDAGVRAAARARLGTERAISS